MSLALWSIIAFRTGITPVVIMVIRPVLTKDLRQSRQAVDVSYMSHCVRGASLCSKHLVQIHAQCCATRGRRIVGSQMT